MANLTSESQRVALAKQRLRGSGISKKVDYLAPVKANPLASVGSAFAAGILLNRLTKGRRLALSPGVVSLGLQLLKKL